MTIEEYRRLLGLPEGIRCLPSLTKSRARTAVSDVGEGCAPIQSFEGLGLVHRYIEPVAGAVAEGGDADFSALCRQLAESEHPGRIAVVLGVEAPEEWNDI